MTHKNKLSRRSFLKGSTLATVGAALAPTIVPSHVLGADAPSNRVTVATIGCGGMGMSNTRTLLSKGKQVQFVAMCDVDKKNLRNGKGTVDAYYGNKDCKTYTDYRDIVARDDIDAVIIATPDHWHAIPAIECANSGKDIYGEKPITHNLIEGRKVCDAVKENGTIWQTGSWQRSRRNFHRGVELVRNGRIGKLKKVEVGLPKGRSGGNPRVGRPPQELNYDMWVGPAPMNPYRKDYVHFNWRWFLDYGGGQLMDWVGHHIDIAHWGVDRDDQGPASVKPINVKYPTEGLWNAPITYKCDCTYADGLVFTVADDSQVANGAKWYGEDGWIHVNRGGIWASDPKILQSKIGPNETQIYKSTDHMQNFLDCIKSRKETITPAETAHRSASVGHLCMIALHTNRTIKWDYKTEKIIADKQAAALLGRANRQPWSL